MINATIWQRQFMRDLSKVKSFSGLNKLLSSSDSNYKVDTVKYNQLYWVYVGNDTSNVLITVTMNDDRIDAVEREQGVDRYELGRSISIRPTQHGKQAFVDNAFNTL